MRQNKCKAGHLLLGMASVDCTLIKSLQVAVSWWKLLGWATGCVHLPSQHREPAWHRALQALCLLPVSLWAYICVSTAVFPWPCFLTILPPSWLYNITLPLFLFLVLRGRVWWRQPITTECFNVSHFQRIVQLWACVSVTIYCRRKFLRWWLNMGIAG